MLGTYSSIKTAVLYAAYGSRASYYDDWLDAFKEASAFDVASFNIAQRQGRVSFKKDVKTFDLIVALHSVNADNLIYAFDIKSALQARKGLFLSFVGNELSLPSAPLNQKLTICERLVSILSRLNYFWNQVDIYMNQQGQKL